MESKDPQLVERYGERGIAAAADARQRAKLRLAFARVKLEGGDYKTARNQAVDAKDEDPDSAGAARGIIGLSALLAGQEDEALAELRFAASQRSEEPRVYRELAALLKKRGELVEARTNAEQSVKLEATDPALWLEVAELRQATQDQPGSKQALEKVIELKSDSAVAHSRLSAILLAEGNLEPAQKAAERACELAPDDLEARLAMGRILLAQDRPKAAQDELEKALKAGTSWEVEFLLGQAMLKTGDVPGGCRRLQSALEKRADDLALHLEAARLAIAASKGKEAEQFLSRVLKAHDANYDLHLLYSEALISQADPRNDAQIQEHLRRCMELDQDRRDAPARLGNYLLEKLDSEGAIEVLKAGLQRNPQDKELLFLKGRACIRAKQWDEAISALQSLEALDRNYPELEQWLRRAREGKFYGE
jgi:tetratricopeptide (TPR) repeat protein